MSGEMTVQVRVELPASQFRALEQLADAHTTTVRSLVRECVRRQLKGKPEALVPKEPHKRVGDQHLQAIRDLNAAGLSDSEIGRRLGIAHSTVSLRRNRMGLPARAAGRRPQAVAA